MYIAEFFSQLRCKPHALQLLSLTYFLNSVETNNFIQYLSASFKEMFVHFNIKERIDNAVYKKLRCFPAFVSDDI